MKFEYEDAELTAEERDEIQDFLERVEQLGVEEDEVNPNAKFIEDLGADSLDTVELVMAFEEEFDLEIPDDRITSIEPLTRRQARDHVTIRSHAALALGVGRAAGEVGRRGPHPADAQRDAGHRHGQPEDRRRQRPGARQFAADGFRAQAHDA